MMQMKIIFVLTFCALRNSSCRRPVANSFTSATEALRLRGSLEKPSEFAWRNWGYRLDRSSVPILSPSL